MSTYYLRHMTTGPYCIEDRTFNLEITSVKFESSVKHNSAFNLHRKKPHLRLADHSGVFFLVKAFCIRTQVRLDKEHLKSAAESIN